MTPQVKPTEDIAAFCASVTSQLQKAPGLAEAETVEEKHQVEDEELVRRVRAKDPHAERTLYERHVRNVYLLSLRVSGDEEVAMTCTQDTFVRVFDKIGQFRGEAQVGTWIHQIGLSVVLGHLRSTKRRQAREVELHQVAHRLAEPSPGVGIIGLKEAIHRAILALPDIYRTVVVLHDLEGFSHDEVGDRLNIAASSSRARLSRARAMLRETLAPYREAIEQ